MNVIPCQVSADRFPETWFGRKLLDENLRTQLLLLLAQLPAPAYTPMNHRRLVSVGFAANDPQTDCWGFCSYKAEEPNVVIFIRHTQDIQTAMRI